MLQRGFWLGLIRSPPNKALQLTMGWRVSGPAALASVGAFVTFAISPLGRPVAAELSPLGVSTHRVLTMSSEPQFMAVASKDPKYQQTITDAQESLAEFRRRTPDLISSGAFPSIKTALCSDEHRAFIWLTVIELDGSDFLAQIFEIPVEFSQFQVGDTVWVPASAVMDWMYHDSGTLHGGYSLRYQRSQLPPEEWPEFDKYIGADRYA